MIQAMRLLPLLAALIAAWQPSKAQAADEDTQLWVITSLTGPIDDNTRLTIDASQRWREAARGDEQQTLRVVVDQAVAKRLTLGGAVAVFEAGGRSEFRLDQQVIVTIGRFALRTRLEERFFDGADQMELRLRQRVLYNQPLGDRWRATVHGEWFGTLQPRIAGSATGTEQWRAQLSVIHQVTDHFDLGASYLGILVPNGDTRDVVTHVPQVTITYRF